MGKAKKSILEKIFGKSKGCSCGVEIVDQEEEKKDETAKTKKIEK